MVNISGPDALCVQWEGRFRRVRSNYVNFLTNCHGTKNAKDIAGVHCGVKNMWGFVTAQRATTEEVPVEITFSITGRRCDLALHPVSSKTADTVEKLGRKVYQKKYIHWWRNGNTSTCGMKYDDEAAVSLKVDGRSVPFDDAPIASSAVLLRRRAYLNSKARFLCLLGYDDEYCTMFWKWNAAQSFDPARFEFFVHRWDRILKADNFLILDEVRYDGQFADESDWGGSCGFSLVDPMVINLDEVRRELAAEEAAMAAAPGAEGAGREEPARKVGAA